MRTIAIDRLCLLFSFHCGAQALSKLFDNIGWRHWLASMPVILQYNVMIAYTAIITQLTVAVLLYLPNTRRWAIVILFWCLIGYEVYLILALTRGIVVQPPYHTYWADATWREVITFNAVLAAMLLSVQWLYISSTPKPTSVQLL